MDGQLTINRRPSPILIAGLIVVVAAGGLLAYLQRDQLAYKAVTFRWKTYENQAEKYSFKYPSTLHPISQGDDSVMLATSENFSPDKLTCNAPYSILSSPNTVPFEDQADIFIDPTMGLFNEFTASQGTVDGHPAHLITGTSTAEKGHEIFAPAGQPIHLAIVENGDSSLLITTCGANPDKKEFDYLLKTFELNGVQTKPTPPSIEQQLKQQAEEVDLKSRDATRTADLHNLQIPLAKYQARIGTYPIHTTCVPLTELQSAFLASETDSLQIHFSDPKRDPANPGYDPAWTDYCYQSNAQGTAYIMWAALEDTNPQGAYSYRLAKNTPPSGFPIPPAYADNGIYQESH